MTSQCCWLHQRLGALAARGPIHKSIQYTCANCPSPCSPCATEPLLSVAAFVIRKATQLAVSKIARSNASDH
eukprot:scaffold1687_cov405-Prasinococcus_capsulatus_cf.AAC.13